MLLILTNRADLAADYLVVRLQERGLPYVRFNTEDFPKDVQISLDNSRQGWKWWIRVQGNKYDSSRFSAIYLRHLVLGDLSEVVSSDVAFAEQEVAEALRSLWRVIPDRLWLNHPRDVWLASNKVLQLATAVELGLPVPRSLVSNSPEDIETFAVGASKHGLVAKAVKHGFTERDGRIVLAGTQEFSPEALTRPGVASSIPLVVQDRVPKRCDVRVVVVDRDVFPVRIHSDISSQAAPDWRLQQLDGAELLHEPFDLPADVEEACRRLPALFGLRYSSMDLIEDPEGTFWFLELNPNGQWAWIEQFAGHPIRDSLIRAFAFEADS